MLSIQAAPTETITHPPPSLEEPAVEGRAQKGDHETLALDDEDLDGRSAYVNNQYVPNDPVELHDEQNAPLYEILQKQMEQVLAATGPDVPIYEDDKSKRQREQQLPNKPLFNSQNNEAEEADDDYADETASDLDQGYADAEKPDATVMDEQLPESDGGYQVPQLSTSSASPTESSSTTTPPPSSSSTASPSTTTPRSRPHRRRTTTTSLPRTTRGKYSAQSKPSGNSSTPASVDQTEPATSTTAAPTVATNHKQRPQILSDKPSSNSNSHANSNSLPHDPQIYQHKRRIIFKTISTGSQFVNSPIGDLMIKFSIGYAKSAQGVPAPTNEALRALSNNLLRNIELQKLKRIKLQKD